MNFAIIWGLAATALAFTPQPQQIRRSTLVCHAKQDLSRRVFVNSVATASVFSAIQVLPAQAVGPIRIGMSPISYSARLCPPDKPSKSLGKCKIFAIIKKSRSLIKLSHDNSAGTKSDARSPPTLCYGESKP